ncbi:MAG: hypothetical protein ACXADY_25915 [Candidatus Hodarchaeales archaeon]|jgi:hypothetical protein
MRVFLKNGKTIEKPNGGSITWPPESFCEVSDERGQKWLDAGEAVLATKDNKVIEQPPEPEPIEDEPTPGPSFDAMIEEEDEDNG